MVEGGDVVKDFQQGSVDQDLYHTKVINNIKFIRDVVKELRPEALVVEMCDDRYEKWLADVIAHPHYEHTVQAIHNILDKKPDKLKEYD